MLVLTSITAMQRFVKVWKQAAVAPVTAGADRDASRAARRVGASRAPSGAAPESPLRDARDPLTGLMP